MKQPTFNDTLPLRDLVRYYLESLGWSQADLARACGWDTAQLSRVLKVDARPYDMSLARIADVLQREGLDGASLEALKASRDRPSTATASNPYDIPNVWLRLIRDVLLLPTDVQDALYRQWSLSRQDAQQLYSRRVLPNAVRTPPRHDDGINIDE